MTDFNKRRLRIALMAVFAVLFLGGGIVLLKFYLNDKAEAEVYDDAVTEYVTPVETVHVIKSGISSDDEEEEIEDVISEEDLEPPPIEIDFNELLEAYPDVEGWIYCEDTVINYPIMHGVDNDQYLHHDYTGAYATAGSIFLEAHNSPGFTDSNNVIYGHHMKNGSMFASLSKWSKQGYYEEHPYMWLLTPEHNYKIELVSGYLTSAYSDTYMIFQGPSEYFDEYLAALKGASDFTDIYDIELDRDAKYVVLSTCDYTFQDARYVLHGKLTLAGKTR